MLGVAVGPTGSVIDGAPSEDAFAKVLEEIRAGRSPWAGVEGVGRFGKIQRMVRCTREGILSLERSYSRAAC
eukprot:1478672-Alexandrium_andersonii.AAC.1